MKTGVGNWITSSAVLPSGVDLISLTYNTITEARRRIIASDRSSIRILVTLDAKAKTFSIAPMERGALKVTIPPPARFIKRRETMSIIEDVYVAGALHEYGHTVAGATGYYVLIDTLEKLIIKQVAGHVPCDDECLKRALSISHNVRNLVEDILLEHVMATITGAGPQVFAPIAANIYDSIRNDCIRYSSLPLGLVSCGRLASLVDEIRANPVVHEMIGDAEYPLNPGVYTLAQSIGDTITASSKKLYDYYESSLATGRAYILSKINKDLRVISSLGYELADAVRAMVENPLQLDRLRSIVNDLYYVPTISAVTSAIVSLATAIVNPPIVEVNDGGHHGAPHPGGGVDDDTSNAKHRMEMYLLLPPQLVKAMATRMALEALSTSRGKTSIYTPRRIGETSQSILTGPPGRVLDYTVYMNPGNPAMWRKKRPVTVPGPARVPAGSVPRRVSVLMDVSGSTIAETYGYPEYGGPVVATVLDVERMIAAAILQPASGMPGASESRVTVSWFSDDVTSIDTHGLNRAVELVSGYPRVDEFGGTNIVQAVEEGMGRLGSEPGGLLIVLTDAMITPYEASKIVEMLSSMPRETGILFLVVNNMLSPEVEEELSKLDNSRNRRVAVLKGETSDREKLLDVVRSINESL